MDTGPLHAAFYNRKEFFGVANPLSHGPIAFCILYEIRVAQIKAEILKTHLGLLPLNHAIAVVPDDEDDQVKTQTNGSFQLLGVHHEPAVAADGHDGPVRIDELCGHGGRQAGPHCGQRVVEEYGVGLVCLVVSCEPDLVHTVIKGDDPVRRHEFPDLRYQALRQDGKGIVIHIPTDVFLDGLLYLAEITEIPGAGVVESRCYPLHTVSDVADNLQLREVHRIHLGGVEVDVDHRHLRAHEEGGFLHHVVADVDDEIGTRDGPVQEVVVGKGRVAQKKGVSLVHDTLAHLGGEERYVGLFNEPLEHPAGDLPVGPGSDEEDGMVGSGD